MKPTKEQIAEARKRGIVPGVECESPYGQSFPALTVDPYTEWFVDRDGALWSKDRLLYSSAHSKWATVIKPAPAKRKTASQPRIKGRFAPKPKEPTQLDGLTIAQYQPFQQEVLRLAREAIHDGMVAYSAAVKHQNSEIKRLSAQITSLQSDVSKIESSVAVIRSGASFMQQLEPWVPKVGDWVVVTAKSGIFSRGHIAKVGRIGPQGGVYMNERGGCGVERKHIRPATPDEVQTHLAAEEAKRKEAEQAEKAKALKFGDRVMTPEGEGIYHRHACHVYHWVIVPHGDKLYNLDQLTPIEP
jgi:hypothetical protein